MSKMIYGLDEDIAQYEHAFGIKVSPKLRSLFADLMIACDKFTELGEEDATSRKPQRGRDVFVRWVKREVPVEVEKNQTIIDLLYDCYTDGYNRCKGGAVRDC